MNGARIRELVAEHSAQWKCTRLERQALEALLRKAIEDVLSEPSEGMLFEGHKAGFFPNSCRRLWTAMAQARSNELEG